MALKQAKNKDQTARIHGNSNNRKAKEKGESRPVFKSVLDNPFDVKWPVIPLNVQNAILARFVELVSGVAEFNLRRHACAVKRRRKEKKGKAKAASKGDMDIDQGEPNGIIGSSVDTYGQEPDVLKHITIGINSVTKQLECQCRMLRQSLSTPKENSKKRLKAGENEKTDAQQEDLSCKSAAAENAQSLSHLSDLPVRAVLVCRSDIDPPLLVSHVPHLVAACNSAPQGAENHRVKLVTLPKGAENTLSQALGLRRVAIVALDGTFSKDTQLSSFLESIPTAIAPWLVGLEGNLREPPKNAESVLSKAKESVGKLELTHIKQLNTTAPKDMRAAKMLRVKGRADAKLKRKARIGVNKVLIN